MQSANAKILIEAGQILKPYAVMTDSGDHKVFTIAGGPVFSGKSGFTPTVRPNGIHSGRNLLSPHADNNKVTIAGFTAYLAGVLVTIAATTGTITRPATDVAKVNSITLKSDESIEVLPGTDGTGSAFSEDREAAGGPPYIPPGSIEIGQVRVTAAADGIILSSEIFQVIGQHAEYSNYPIFRVNNTGDGEYASVSAKKNSFVEFESALPLIHTADVPKGVYLQYYTPVLAALGRVFDFVPVEKSHSVGSKQYYRGSIGTMSESLGQGSFTAIMDDNITDLLVSEKNQILTVKFFQDENLAPYILTQGKIGLKRSFPAADQNQATVTLSAEEPSVEFAS